MKIHEMELLIRVAETGSMTLAAQQMHITPAAVSGSIQRIENAIGVRLFERTMRSLHPTDEGLLVLEGCQDVVKRWQRVLDEARGNRAEIRGTVRLSAPTDTTYQILESVIVSVCSEYPEIRVVLDPSDAVQHLHRDAIDMAIRYGLLQDSSLSARKLAGGSGILVASPAYLATREAPKTPDALAHHRCLTLQLSNAPTVSWQLHGPSGVHTFSFESPLCGNGYLARKWAIAGMGITFKSLFDVIDDLEAGRLVRVLPEYTLGEIPIHVVFPSRRFLPMRVRVLDKAITVHFAERAARCEAWLQQSGGS